MLVCWWNARCRLSRLDIRLFNYQTTSQSLFRSRKSTFVLERLRFLIPRRYNWTIVCKAKLLETLPRRTKILVTKLAFIRSPREYLCPGAYEFDGRRDFIRCECFGNHFRVTILVDASTEFCSRKAMVAMCSDELSFQRICQNSEKYRFLWVG